MNIVHISNYSNNKQTMTIMRRIYLQKLMAADHLLKLLLTTGFYWLQQRLFGPFKMIYSDGMYYFSVNSSSKAKFN